MEPIKQWFLSLSGATAITGVFNIFLSNSNFKKAINVFLSIFVLFYTVIPLTDIKKTNYDFNFESIELNEFSEENYEQVIITAIQGACEENNVELFSVDIDSHISDDSLVVEKIIVDIDNSANAEKIQKILYEQYGFEVSVI